MQRIGFVSLAFRRISRKTAAPVAGYLLLLFLAVLGLAGSATAQACPSTSPDYPCAYVANNSADTLSVLGNNNTVIATIQLAEGGGPTGVAITPDNSTVYVAEGSNGTLEVIDTATDTVTTTITLSGNPTAIAITPNGRFAYVTEPGVVGSSSIQVIDTSSNTISATISNLSLPTGIAIAPNGAFAYAADECPTPSVACVDVINLSTNKVTTTIQIAGTSTSQPNSIAVSADGASVYLTAVDATSKDVEICVIATSTNTVVVSGDTLDIGGFLTSAYGFAIAPNKTLYLGIPSGTDGQRETTVYTLATSTNTLLSPITVGQDPTGLAVGRSGGIVYVTNNFDGTVSLIATGNNSVSGPITVGTSPTGVAAMRVAAVPLINEPLVPSATPSGGAGFTLTVNGTGFASNSVVNWNGAALATQVVSQGQLTATVPKANIATFGTASITVTTPGPGGGTSNAVPFTVTSSTTALTFAALTDPVGVAPVYVVAADFNHDGKADLAVVNSSSGTVSILLGNGDGTFTTGTALTTGLDPVSAVAGDFNGDGKLDLAVVANDDVDCDDGSKCSEIDIFLGNGDGTFTSGTTVQVFNEGAAPGQLIAADFNGDGKTDLALATSINSVGSVFVYLGSGDGTFTSTSSSAVSAVPTSLVSGDFNGDGILDLAVAEGSSPAAEILIGNGDGTFTLGSPLTTNLSTPQSVTTGDFNGDGILDLAFADSSNGILTVLLGNGTRGVGDGTFTEKSGQPVASQDLRYVTTADFNGDGKLDLALVGELGDSVGQIFVDLGNGDGTFQASTGVTAGNVPVALAFADFNGDGRLDLAVANSADNRVSILEQSPVVSPNSPSLAFGNEIINTTSSSQSVTFTNSGSAPLLFVPTIGAGFTQTNNCPVASGSTLLLAAGASCSFEVSFAPTSLGAFATTLSLGVSLPAPSVTSVSLTGTGTPVPVEITTQPSSQTINAGQTATLTVVATGTAPLTYQWFVGASGTTTNPISGATSASFTTPALAVTTSYWVRVTNGAGSKDSNTATITVVVPPQITIQPASQTINSGLTATLTVTATGTALTYQWFQGSSGDTSNPITGANSSSFTTPALVATTSYWVQVSNAAGSKDSNTATITVVPVAPQITTQPASQTINSGQAATLTVIATGTPTLTYQWFQGLSGDTSNPITGATKSSFTTPALVATTSYWVKVSNAAGSKNSNTATITVTSTAAPSCSNQTVGPGAGVLQVTFTATCSATTVATSINWGDGSALTTGSSAAVSATHTYAAAGTFSLTLTATDGLGRTSAPAFAQVTLIAAQAPPPVFAGQSSDTPLMLTAPPNPTNNPVVKFECTTATPANGIAQPAADLGLSCTSDPPTLTLTNVPQNVTISVQTSGTAAQLRLPGSKHLAPLYASWLPLPGLIFMGLWTGLGSRGRKKLLRYLALGLLICLVVFGASCGGGFTSPSISNSGSGSAKATPAGKYFVTAVDVPAQGPPPSGFVQTSLIVPLTVTGQ